MTDARRSLSVLARALSEVEAGVEALLTQAYSDRVAKMGRGNVLLDGEELLTADNTAAWLRTSKATLARWRTLGTGPEYIKMSGRIFYRTAVLEAFLASSQRKKTRALQMG